MIYGRQDIQYQQQYNLDNVVWITAVARLLMSHIAAQWWSNVFLKTIKISQYGQLIGNKNNRNSLSLKVGEEYNITDIIVRMITYSH